MRNSLSKLKLLWITAVRLLSNLPQCPEILWDRCKIACEPSSHQQLLFSSSGSNEEPGVNDLDRYKHIRMIWKIRVDLQKDRSKYLLYFSNSNDQFKQLQNTATLHNIEKSTFS